jgi:hypothetical protein
LHLQSCQVNRSSLWLIKLGCQQIRLVTVGAAEDAD